jgi:hypothetical protein
MCASFRRERREGVRYVCIFQAFMFRPSKSQTLFSETLHLQDASTKN